MSWTTAAECTTTATCSGITKRAWCGSWRTSIHMAPFSATPSSAGRMQRSRPSSSCGSPTWAGSKVGCPTPGTSDAIRRASRWTGSCRSARSAAGRSGTRMQGPPTAATISANWATASGNRTPRPAVPGCSTRGGWARRTAWRMSSRLPTRGLLATAVELPEGLAGRLGELALPGPPAPEEADPGPGQDPQGEARQPPRQGVDPGRAEGQGGEPHPEPLPGGEQPPVDDLAAPGEQLVVQVDPGRADVAAGAAQRRGEGKGPVGGQVAGRGQHRADGSGDHPGVGVAAAAAVDRAGVEAGAAADAGQRPPEAPLGQQARAAVVDQHDVELAAPARAVEMAGVAGDGLTDGAARQEPEEDRQVLGPGDELLDPHRGDVEEGQRGAHVG